MDRNSREKSKMFINNQNRNPVSFLGGRWRNNRQIKGNIQPICCFLEGNMVGAFTGT